MQLSKCKTGPQVGFGKLRIKTQCFLKVGDRLLGAATELLGQVVVPYPAADIRQCEFWIEFERFVDFVQRAMAVLKAEQRARGNDLTAESAEQAMILRRLAVERNCFASGFDPGFGSLRRGSFVLQFQRDLGEIRLSQCQTVVSFGVVAVLCCCCRSVSDGSFQCGTILRVACGFESGRGNRNNGRRSRPELFGWFSYFIYNFATRR